MKSIYIFSIGPTCFALAREQEDGAYIIERVAPTQEGHLRVLHHTAGDNIQMQEAVRAMLPFGMRGHISTEQRERP